MSVKLVRISMSVHKPLAIQAATEGVTISSIVDRAIREELKRIRKGAAKAKKASQKGSAEAYHEVKP